MGMPERKYSDEQLEAMIYTRAKLNLPYKQGRALLAEKGIPELGVEPFDASESTMRGYVPPKIRERQGAGLIEKPSDEAAEYLTRRLLVLAQTETAKLESVHRNGAKLDLKRLDDLSKIVQRLRSPGRVKPTETPKPSEPAEPQVPPRSAFEDQLAGDRPSQETDPTSGTEPSDKAKADVQLGSALPLVPSHA